MVLLEAGAVGKPVVAFDVGGISDAVINGKSGVLLKPKDYRQLANSLVELLIKPDERRAMGEFSRRRILKELSLDGMVKRYETVSNFVMGFAGKRSSAQARSQKKAPIF
jgi:glycosyltransferase involved in cell wall biosynthesis